jgi:glutathione synthase/RimK-type ligase-like ATP-grasp enzyme
MKRVKIPFRKSAKNKTNNLAFVAICLRPVIAKNVFACGGTNIKLTGKEDKKQFWSNRFTRKESYQLTLSPSYSQLQDFINLVKKQKNYIFTKYLGIKK